jgi:hypothetical protein
MLRSFIVLLMRRTVSAYARILPVCVVLLSGYLFAGPVEAATHRIASSTTNVDCSTFSGGVRAGDTVILTGRSRGPIKFSNCVGSRTEPIVIRNDTSESGPLVVNMNGDGMQTQCTNCEYVVIDGTGKWAGAPSGVCGASIDRGTWSLGLANCGIVMRCVSGRPHSGIRIGGNSKNVTVKGLEIDGSGPSCQVRIGMSVNDHGYKARAGEWREGFRLINNYVHGSEGEGIYFGPNQTQNGTTDMLVRDNEIGNNVVSDTGCDGITYKSAVAGSSSIHHNHITNTGQSPRDITDGCSGTGIELFESGYTDIHSNYVEAPTPVSDGPGHCIAQAITHLSASVVQTVPVSIYNNVLRNCKGDGVAVWRSGASAAAPIPDVRHNTIIAPIGGDGIDIRSSVNSCMVRGNILAGGRVAASNCVVGGNMLGEVDTQRFRDAGKRDYRLTADSPAVNGATGSCPSVDLLGTSRPSERCDQGAFEFVQAGEEDKQPNPPAIVGVE